jgi:hypothetical protein
MSKKITDLPAKTSIDGSDLLPLVDNAGIATTKKITFANFESSIQLTQDQIVPGFSITLALASGAGSPVEVGATWTPTFNIAYSPNSTGLTAVTITDTNGGSGSRLGSSNPVTGPSTTYSKSTVNATVTVSVNAIRNSISKSSNGISQQWEPKCWYGVGTAGATGLNGTTGALIGATGTLTGQLRSSRAGSSATNPSNQKVYFASPVSYGSVTFKDQNGFTFSMNSPTVISVTNQFGIVISYNIYESTNLLNTAYTVTES